MILRINPGNWIFNIVNGPWTWEVNDEDMIIFRAIGYDSAPVWESSINPDDHLPSRFVVDVDGQIIFTNDPMDDGGYQIYIEQSGDYVSAITLWKNPEYDEMYDLGMRMGAL